MKAWMDGTNPVPIVSGLSSPAGIALDYNSRKLFWTDFGTDKIQSSDLDGRNVQTVATVSKPYGIAVSENRLYFGTFSSPSVLQSCGMTGRDMKILHRDPKKMRHIGVAPSHSTPATRRNHSAGRTCPEKGICVLTPYSFRCLRKDLVD